jgi:hypothetical protein
MCKFGNKWKLFLVMSVAALLFADAAAAAGAKSPQGDEALLDTYRRNKTRLTNSFGMPLFLDSFEQGDRVNVDVYGIFDYPFSSVASMLKIPANWCDIVSLHQNVKACTYRESADAWLLTFYVGRKVYQAPAAARQVTYRYRVITQEQGYLDIVLTADEGPFGTRDHSMRFEALTLDGGRTFVHVSYAYVDSAALRLAAKAYFSTFGRNKAGFTVSGTDKNGKAVYIGGPRGSIERNAARYYFAIQSYMSTLRYAEENRFNMRISEWYDLTNRYRRQLFELEKADYLAAKIVEHKNQLTLQQKIGTGLQTVTERPGAQVPQLKKAH